MPHGGCPLINVFFGPDTARATYPIGRMDARVLCGGRVGEGPPRGGGSVFQLLGWDALPPLPPSARRRPQGPISRGGSRAFEVREFVPGFRPGSPSRRFFRARGWTGG